MLIVQSFLNKISSVLSWFGFVSVLVLVILIAHDVFMRYVLNNPTRWTTEVAMGIQLLFGFLCAGYVLKEDGHIRMEAVLLSVRRITRLWMLMITSILSFFLCVILVYYSWLMALSSLRMDERTGVVGYPTYILKFAVVLGFSLLGVQFIAEAFKYWKSIRKNRNDN